MRATAIRSAEERPGSAGEGHALGMASAEARSLAHGGGGPDTGLGDGHSGLAHQSAQARSTARYQSILSGAPSVVALQRMAEASQSLDADATLSPAVVQRAAGPVTGGPVIQRLTGGQRYTFVNNLRVAWACAANDASTAVQEIEAVYPAIEDVRRFLGQDGTAPVITTRANYTALKNAFGLNTMYLRLLAGRTEAELLARMEVDAHWDHSEANFDWLTANANLQLTFVEWWASNAYHHAHNCELRVDADGRRWGYIHIHYTDREDATAENISFIHLKATSLGASLAQLATDGAAAQAAQAVVDANVGTQINPPPWEVDDRAAQASAAADTAEQQANQADAAAAAAVVAANAINTAVGHSPAARNVVVARRVTAAAEAATAHQGAVDAAAAAVNARAQAQTARTFPSTAADRLAAVQQAEADVGTAQGHAQTAVAASQRAVTAKNEAQGARVAHPMAGGWAALFNH